MAKALIAESFLSFSLETMESTRALTIESILSLVLSLGFEAAVQAEIRKRAIKQGYIIFLNIVNKNTII